MSQFLFRFRCANFPNPTGDAYLNLPETLNLHLVAPIGECPPGPHTFHDWPRAPPMEPK